MTLNLISSRDEDCRSHSDRQSGRAVSFQSAKSNGDFNISLHHLPGRMAETLFFDASSDHNPRLNVQTRNDVDANERRTVEALSIVRKDIANVSVRLALNVYRDDACGFKKSR